MTVAVECEHVYFSYGNTPVLEDICFRVFAGEWIGIIGPNGGGKTTLLKLIMGFLKPHQGKIRLFGKPVNPYSCVAYVPQTQRFDKQFPISVLEVVLSGLLSKLPWYGLFSSSERKAAYEALERVGLASFAQAPFGTLSGGQAQRVLIARALVAQPKLLLLDEPTASVDSRAEAEIYTLLKDLKGSLTMLMVTHDLQAAVDQVDRVLCVQGHVYSLKPEEVCGHFAMGLYHAPLVRQPHPVRTEWKT